MEDNILSAFKLSTIVLISEKGYEMLNHPLRLDILSLVGRGISSVSEISKRLRVNKGIISRHLKMLWKIGLLEREDKRYLLSSPILLVYTVLRDGPLRLTVKPVGGFFDPNTRIYLLIGGKGTVGASNCRRCENLAKCIRSVKTIAKKLKVKLRAESPAEAYLEIASAIAERALKKAITLKIALK